jgi:alpha-L-arabinofuranosidase
MGTLVEGLTAESPHDAPWNFLGYRSGFRFNGTGAVVDQWMLLCQETEALPWLTIGGANTPDDYYQLISYLAAPADFDDDSRRRSDHGYEKPWTEQFDTVYIEIGNEWWNPIFRPFYIWDAEKYGEMCEHIIARMKAHPHFDEDRIQIVAGGWAVNAHHWNTKLDAASEGHDIISLAPYLAYEMNEFASEEMRYGTLFAGVEAYEQGEAVGILEGLAKNGKDTRLAVYEINTHITTGQIPSHVVSEIAPSVAAGVAVLDHTMAILENMKAWPINYFNLLQRRYGFGENVRVGMWGNLIRTDKGELRPRPIWEAMRLANEFLIAGDMVRVEIDGSPTWDFPGNGNVPELDNLPYIHAYAFRTNSDAGTDQYNVLIINRHLSETQPVAVELPFTPRNPVKRITLTGDHLYDNNEDELKITLEESEEEGVDSGSRFLVPPFSAVVYQFVNAG